MTFTSAPELPDFIKDVFPYTRRCYELQTGRHAGKLLHFVDHGPKDSPAVLMLHGNPTWSFLWRKVIALLEHQGFRLLAPDLLGLGLSSKLNKIKDHSIDTHADAVSEWLDALNLKNIIIAAQDWGGPIAAGVGYRKPERVAGLLMSNTSILVPRRLHTSPFHRFARMPVVSDIVFRYLSFPQRNLAIAQGDKSSIKGDTGRAYQWPLQSLKDRIAPLAMARMVPNTPDHPSVQALEKGEQWAKSFQGPMRLVWGMKDPILGGALKRHALTFPQALVVKTDAGHFLQEEVPQELADAIQSIHQDLQPEN